MLPIGFFNIFMASDRQRRSDISSRTASSPASEAAAADAYSREEWKECEPNVGKASPPPPIGLGDGLGVLLHGLEVLLLDGNYAT